MFFKKYVFGETAVYYVESPVEGHDGVATIGLALYPVHVVVDETKLFCDSLVQVAFTGDEALIDYTEGVTMRNHSSTILKIVEQTSDMGGVKTVLCDEKGNFYTHNLCYDEGTGVFRVSVEYENRSRETRTLERLDSFSLSGIAAPSKELKSTVGLRLHRMTSAWSRECRLKADSFSSLGLDMSWARYGVKVEEWGQVGSMPNRGYFPFGAIEDEDANVVWGVMLEAPFSWQMEVYQEKETCAFSGGLSDYDRGHWRKRIGAGERFATHAAYIAVKESVNAALNALVHYQDNHLIVPASEEKMPVMFNEYCTTWGCPSEENITRILAAIEGLPIDYFVIDCGWYKPENKGWCNAIGDWRESRALFPHGIKAVANKIRAAGMKAGIWYEFEVAGRDSDMFRNENMLLTRDGAPLTTKNRRFLDLRKDEVVSFLEEKLLKQLKQNGFEYLKIDYNDTYGVGCDGADGLGEGGRQIADESLVWLDRLKETVPDIVIENCSSGGSRIEPKRMSMVSMCSFSDAHECPEIPLVAASVSRVIPARQSQIWAVLRAGESDARTIYSLCAAMMGRICFSGDVLGLTPEKKKLIKEGLAFYEDVKDIVRRGDIVQVDCDIEYYRVPKGRQIYTKELRDRRLVIVHSLEFEGEITLPFETYGLVRAFTDMPYEISECGVKVRCTPYHAGAFLLKK